MIPQISLANLRLAAVNGRSIAVATIVNGGAAVGERPLIEVLMDEQRGALEITNHKQALQQLVIGLGFAA